MASLIGYGLVAFGSGGAGALLVGVGAALGLVGDALQVSEYHKFVDGALQDADIPPAVGAYASWTPDAQDLVVQFAVQHQMSVQKAFLLLHDAYSKLVATGTPRPVMADTVKVAISSIENDVPVPSGGGGQRAHFR